MRTSQFNLFGAPLVVLPRLTRAESGNPNILVLSPTISDSLTATVPACHEFVPSASGPDLANAAPQAEKKGN
jgi:hypothetical protein